MLHEVLGSFVLHVFHVSHEVLGSVRYYYSTTTTTMYYYSHLYYKTKQLGSHVIHVLH